MTTPLANKLRLKAFSRCKYYKYIKLLGMFTNIYKLNFIYKAREIASVAVWPCRQGLRTSVFTASLSNPQPVGRTQPGMALKEAQHKLAN